LAYLKTSADVAQHPIERGEADRRGPFDRLAQRASYFSSSPAFFVICLLLVAAWLDARAGDRHR
jgi:hypothetical protein